MLIPQYFLQFFSLEKRIAYKLGLILKLEASTFRMSFYFVVRCFLHIIQRIEFLLEIEEQFPQATFSE